MIEVVLRYIVRILKLYFLDRYCKECGNGWAFESDDASDDNPKRLYGEICVGPLCTTKITCLHISCGNSMMHGSGLFNAGLTADKAAIAGPEDLVCNDCKDFLLSCLTSDEAVC